MAESGRPQRCGMRTACRIGWFLSALALFTMGSIDVTDTSKTPHNVQSLHETYHSLDDNYLSIQEGSSQNDQSAPGDHSAPDSYGYYFRNNQLIHKADNFPPYTSQRRSVSRVHYSYYTTRSPQTHENSNKRRHKRQRDKSKKRQLGRSKKRRPLKNPKVRRLNPDSTVGGLPNPTISRKTSRKLNSHRDTKPPIRKTSHQHSFSSPSVSRIEKSTSESTSSASALPVNTLRDQLHPYKNGSKSDKTKHRDIQIDQPPNFTVNSLRTAAAAVNSKAYYSHDPFLNPPADRYDLRPAKERVVPQTTTLMPKFVQNGSRKVIPDPYFVPGPTKVVAHEGGVAILPCGVRYLEMSQVSWGKVGREYLLSIGPDVWVKDNRLSVVTREGPEEEESHWDLRIRHVALDDEGEYMCEIIANEKTVRTVQLQIVDKPPYNPVITIEGRKFVESVHTAYIRCNATEGDRFPEDIDWFKNGDKIDSMSYPNILITKYRSEMTLTLVSELAVMRASAKDSGTYICRSSPQLIASLDVNVLVADKSNVKRGHSSNETNSSQSDTQTAEKDFNKNRSSQKKYDNLLYLNIVVILCLIGRLKVT